MNLKLLALQKPQHSKSSNFQCSNVKNKLQILQNLFFLNDVWLNKTFANMLLCGINKNVKKNFTGVFFKSATNHFAHISSL